MLERLPSSLTSPAGEPTNQGAQNGKSEEKDGEAQEARQDRAEGKGQEPVNWFVLVAVLILIAMAVL